MICSQVNWTWLDVRMNQCILLDDAIHHDMSIHVCHQRPQRLVLSNRSHYNALTEPTSPQHDIHKQPKQASRDNHIRGFQTTAESAAQAHHRGAVGPTPCDLSNAQPSPMADCTVIAPLCHRSCSSLSVYVQGYQLHTSRTGNVLSIRGKASERIRFPQKQRWTAGDCSRDCMYTISALALSRKGWGLLSQLHQCLPSGISAC